MTDTRYTDTVVSGVPVVATPEEVDLTTADQLRTTLLHAATDGCPVVVDMTGTSFCDSAGLHALMAAHERARSEGGELRLVIPAGGGVSRILAMMGVDRYVPCFARLDEALAATPRGQVLHELGPASGAMGAQPSSAR